MVKRRRKRKLSHTSRIIKAREYFKLPKGLSGKAAMSMAKSKMRHDHRGFSYNPKTGEFIAT